MQKWLFGDDGLTQSIISCCARLKTSTLFEDKVSALNELEILSKEHPLEVGIKSISVLCDDVLFSFVNDRILIKKCIDILMLLLLPPEQPYDINSLQRHPTTNRIYYEYNLDLLFNKSANNNVTDRIDIFIKLLGDDFNELIEIQYNIIQILTVILLYKNTAYKLRTELINIYGAMNTLSQLLNSNHEFIRNSSIILLGHLSETDPSIQKLIAFDGAFERILTIINDADDENGVVIDDCLYLMQNLMRNNQSNQKYFVEIGCVKQLKQLLIINEHKIKIIHKIITILLEIIKNCGHLHTTQIAFGQIIESLCVIISYRNEAQQINLIKEKCLILLRILLFMNKNNANIFITLGSSKYLLFLLNAALSNKNYLSHLSLHVLKALLCSNKDLQKRLTESFINKKGSFGELLYKYNNTCDTYDYYKILIYLLNDNHNTKIIFINHFIDILMRKLNENTPKNVQIGILLLICCICYNCREAIYKIFSNTNYIFTILNLAMLKLNNNNGGNDYNRGLSTYLIAICLEFAKDLTFTQHKQKNINLFYIINNKISLNTFKSNLEKLRNTTEYIKMIEVMQQCKEKITPNNNGNVFESKKKILIQEIFINDLESKNDECLFDTTFIAQFESIYSVIDKRIIQLISTKNDNHENNNNRNFLANYDEEKEGQSLNKSQAANNDLNKNDEILNEKINEINELKKQMKQQNQTIINQKKQIQKQQENMNKYNNLRKTYHALNRDHEELLVFVGHLNENYERIQKELVSLKKNNHNDNNNNGPFSPPDLV